MQVQELISELLKMPADANVLYRYRDVELGYEYGTINSMYLDNDSDIVLSMLNPDALKKSFDEEHKEAEDNARMFRLWRGEPS